MDNDRYDLHDTAYGVQGWDAIMEADMQILNDQIPTRILGTLGETVLAYQPLYFKSSDLKWYKAQANGVKRPAQGIAVEGGGSSDVIRIHRMGEIVNLLWAWSSVGSPIYLSPDVLGELTQMPPITERQLMGYALSATKMLVIILPPVLIDLPIHSDNLDAIGGGLNVGDFYRTGGDPDLVCVVHAESS
jgi:hypothetical protein